MGEATPVHVDGLVNARDLGGIHTSDGRVVKPGRLIRSDNPRGITERGRDDFIELIGPTTVLDMRMEIEVEREGYTLHDHIHVINLPMQPLSGVNQEQIDAGAHDNLLDDYLAQVEVNAHSLIRALEVISDPANQPVLVHCTAGKDRTGMVIALTLDLLGVPHEYIVADYHVTHANMGPILDRIRNAPVFKENGLAAAPDWIFAAEPETMRGFLAEFTRRYGSAEAYALGKGLAPEAIASLRASLLA